MRTRGGTGRLNGEEVIFDLKNGKREHRICGRISQLIIFLREITPFLIGSVSQILKWVLQYINRKLSLRPIIASNKILSLLKGHIIINKKQSCAPFYCDFVSSR